MATAKKEKTNIQFIQLAKLHNLVKFFLAGF